MPGYEDLKREHSELVAQLSRPAYLPVVLSVLALLSPFIAGGVVWAWQLSGRVTTIETWKVEHVKQPHGGVIKTLNELDTRGQLQQKDLEELKKKVERLEDAD